MNAAEITRNAITTIGLAGVNAYLVRASLQDNEPGGQRT